MNPTASRPAYLFVSSTDGALHDTRRDWSAQPLRPVYRRTFARIDTAAQLKATLRAGEFSWPGGYPLYFITDDGAALSFDAVRENFRAVLDSIRRDWSDGWRVVACAVNWEEPDLICEHSGQPIPSAHA